MPTDLDALAAKTKARLEAKRKEREEAERIDRLAKDAYKKELEEKTGSEFVEPEEAPAAVVGEPAAPEEPVKESGKKIRVCEQCKDVPAVAKVTLSDGSVLKACQGCIDALAGGEEPPPPPHDDDEVPGPPPDEPLTVNLGPTRKPPMAGAVNIFGGMGLGGGVPALPSRGRGGGAGRGGPGRGRGGPGRGPPGRGPGRGGPGRGRGPPPGRMGPGRGGGMMGGGGPPGAGPNKVLNERIAGLEAKIKLIEERADENAALLEKLMAQLQK